VSLFVFQEAYLPNARSSQWISLEQTHFAQTSRNFAPHQPSPRTHRNLQAKSERNTCWTKARYVGGPST